VAAVGVATVNYVAIACGGNTEPTSGNLPAPQPTTERDRDASTHPPTSGNLPSPTSTTTSTTPPTSGNLPSPQPVDAGPDADSGVK
jgi:hypothetical protein